MPTTPKDAADDCLARARRMLQAAGDAGSASDDLRRMALVMGVAALDTYMHAVVRSRLQNNRGGIPKALKRLDIPFEELASLAETTLTARRKGRTSRPWVQVKNALHRKLLKMTFQSYEDVGLAMAMAGVRRGWKKIAHRMGSKPEDIKNRLNGIVHRRNQIVHEGDLRRLVRPRTVDHNPILEQRVREDIDWLEELIGAIDSVI